MEIGGETIRRSDFEPYYRQYLADFSIPDQAASRGQCLKLMMENRLLKQIACSLGMDTTRFYRLKKQQIEMITTVSHYKQAEVGKELTVDSLELRQAYHRSMSRITLRYLYSPEKGEIDSLYRRITTGADTVVSWSKSYELGFGEMEEEIEEQAYQLKPGQTSKPIASMSGYTIIQVLERIDQPISTETDYLQKREHMMILLKERKVKHILQRKSKEMIGRLGFKPYPEAIRHFYNLIRSPAPPESGIPPETILYEALGQPVTAYEVLDKIRLVYPEDRNWIRTERQLEKFLLSLAFRDYLFEQAREAGYERSETVQSEIGRKLNFFLIDQLTRMLKQTIDTAEIRAFYRQHRDSLEAGQGPLLEIMSFPSRIPADSLYLELKTMPEKWGKIKRRVKTRQYPWSSLHDLPPQLKNRIIDSQADSILPPFPFRGQFRLAKILKRSNPNGENDSIPSSMHNQIQIHLLNLERIKFLDYWQQRIPIRIDSSAIRRLNS